MFHTIVVYKNLTKIISLKLKLIKYIKKNSNETLELTLSIDSLHLSKKSKTFSVALIVKAMADKFDVFVGNLTFNTTEDQLREKFSFVGPVKNVRMLTDKETGKPKGFAFVEYFDANTALAAIGHLDQVEVNSRKLKVGYPAQSNLREIARQIGQLAPESSADGGTGGGGGSGGNVIASAATRLKIEQNVIDSIKLHEAWDLLDAMKKLVAEDNNRGNKAKAILETHPQLISALYEIHKRLGIALPKNVQQQQATLAAAVETAKELAAASAACAPAAAVEAPPVVFMPPPAMSSLMAGNAMRDWDDRGDHWGGAGDYRREYAGGGWEGDRGAWDRPQAGGYYDAPYDGGAPQYAQDPYRQRQGFSQDYPPQQVLRAIALLSI